MWHMWTKSFYVTFLLLLKNLQLKWFIRGRSRDDCGNHGPVERSSNNKNNNNEAKHNNNINNALQYLDRRMTQTWWHVAIMAQVRQAIGEQRMKVILAPRTCQQWSRRQKSLATWFTRPPTRQPITFSMKKVLVRRANVRLQGYIFSF